MLNLNYALMTLGVRQEKNVNKNKRKDICELNTDVI